MPAYNSSSTITRAVDSILTQTFTDFELIILDDYSTDQTAAIVRDYIKQDKRIRLVQNSTNQGIATNRNLAVAESRGKYIAFIDSDDYVDPKYLETLYKNLQESKSDITACSYVEEYQNASIAPPFKPNASPHILAPKPFMNTSDTATWALLPPANSSKNPYSTESLSQTAAFLKTSRFAISYLQKPSKLHSSRNTSITTSKKAPQPFINANPCATLSSSSLSPTKSRTISTASRINPTSFTFVFAPISQLSTSPFPLIHPLHLSHAKLSNTSVLIS